MFDYFIIPLADIIKNNEGLSQKEIEVILQPIFKSFETINNPETTNFLNNSAVLFELSGRGRTFLIHQASTGKLLGYFTLSLDVIKNDDLSKNLWKKLGGPGTKDKDAIPCILLGQMARNDSASYTDLPRGTLFSLILEYINMGRTYFGGRILLAECEDLTNANGHTLRQYYEEKLNFQYIKKNPKTKLNQLVYYF